MEWIITVLIVMASQEYICIEMYQMGQLNYGQFIIYQLQFSKVEKWKVLWVEYYFKVLNFYLFRRLL